MKYSVIMISYLEDYPGCAAYREHKLVRSIQSFLNNDYPDKELIIVSDGCQKTIKIVECFFKGEDSIKVVYTEKSPGLFPGPKRQLGIENATGNRIMYLDCDDYLTSDHISFIDKQWEEEYDWVWWSWKRPIVKKEDGLWHHLKSEKTSHSFTMRPDIDHMWINQFIKIEDGEVFATGTGSIAHSKKIDCKWDKSGIGEDKHFIENGLMKNYKKFKKVNAGYLVCHFNNFIRNKNNELVMEQIYDI